MLAKLNMVDLAGSERLAKTGAVGQIAKEVGRRLPASRATYQHTEVAARVRRAVALVRGREGSPHRCRAPQATFINKSLTFLEQVVVASPDRGARVARMARRDADIDRSIGPNMFRAQQISPL